MLALDLVKSKQVNRVPMLVLGAEDDALVSQRKFVAPLRFTVPRQRSSPTWVTT